MAINIKKIGTFGISFSKGLDQTWFNLWRKEDGYSMDLYQSVDDEANEDDELISTIKKISLDLGESILTQVFENGHLEQWKTRYTESDEGPTSSLNWTIDVDDLANADLLLLSGNWKFPPNGWMAEVIRAIRMGEPDFGKCFQDLL